MLQATQLRRRPDLRKVICEAQMMQEPNGETRGGEKAHMALVTHKSVGHDVKQSNMIGEMSLCLLLVLGGHVLHMNRTRGLRS